MRSPIRRLGRNHTVVAAYVALFTALGGSAYAANVVTSTDIADETIQAQDIAPGAVANEELRDESVTHHKLHYSSVDGSKVINGSLSGPDVANGGLSGADLADGSVKAADLNLVTVQQESGSDPQMAKTVSATCPSGMTPTGGGGNILAPWGANPQNRISLVQSQPTGSSWTVRAEVIKHPATLDFTLKKDEEGYVTGVASYIKADHLTYDGSWPVKAWAVCV
jgi:hypothetical protein